MNSKQITFALILSGGLLTIGSAAHFGVAWEEQHAIAVARLQKEEAAYERQTSALKTAESLSVSKTEDGATTPDIALTKAFLSLSASAMANGVTHSTVTVAGAPVTSHAAAINSLFHALPGTDNRIVTAVLKTKGRYTDYDGFQKYLASISQIPASVRMIGVNKQSFQMEIRVYSVR